MDKTPGELLTDAMYNSIRKAHKEHARGQIKIGLVAFGGYGDFLRLMTFARAVRKRHGAKSAYITLITRYMSPTYTLGNDPKEAVEGHDTLTELLYAMGGQQKYQFNHLVQIPLHGGMTWERAVDALMHSFDMLWEVRYTAGLHVRNWDKFGGNALVADNFLKRFSCYHSGFPYKNNDLDNLPHSQWELLKHSSGLDVDERDLQIKIAGPDATGAYQVGGRKWRPIIELPPPGMRYVVWHNGAGGKALAKCLPMARVVDSVNVLRNAGYEIVQVGSKAKEDPIPGAHDRRGTAVLDTLLLLRGACGHFDIEGGVAYMGQAVRQDRPPPSSVVFFGPTPVKLFGFERSYKCSRFDCPPCWWSKPKWDRKCMRGYESCLNFPQNKREMAEATERWLDSPAAISSLPPSTTPLPPIQDTRGS